MELVTEEIVELVTDETMELEQMDPWSRTMRKSGREWRSLEPGQP